MTSLGEFLSARLGAGAFTVEQVLGHMLPLMRQVIATHAQGLVAPLEGIGALKVEGAAIWYADADRRAPRLNPAALRAIDAPDGSDGAAPAGRRDARDTHDAAAQAQGISAAVGAPGAEIACPVYLPGYVAWEHAVGHHDPLVDVFSLGMLLAALACGLDFTRGDALSRFVANRGNLFALNRDLHPALAQAIVRMTVLSRHARPGDLRAIVRSLENYRDQPVHIDFDLAAVKGFKERDLRGKRQIVLAALKNRLFELSRRNRLLDFRDTLGALNLTEASVPLSVDENDEEANRILSWGGRFAETLSRGASVSLNDHIDFRDALYAGPALDRIRAESQRDAAEFGFQQLRLAVCFLRWADLKTSPPERYFSPLVLLPVTLVKKKGVRDTYHIEPISETAEVNPVLRHLFRQLYGIELPAGIDLAEASLSDLYRALERMIRASDPAVTLALIDGPRVELLRDRARRRLDLYLRRARIAGKGVRRFMSLPYSYDPANFHPLGLQMFNAWIRPGEPRLRAGRGEASGERRSSRADPPPPGAGRGKRWSAPSGAGVGSPYAWEFDLCRVTLGNFHYRKMTLVRDYEDLLENDRPNAAFDAVFSLAPKPLDAEGAAPPPEEERYDIVTCDPTQAAAIGMARGGVSYIIQGPPGTGKSQTITNLIADFVARGKRVLFVCEKRAAIDVVYLRLKQKGLADLCCLIHDSQADKKGFVGDLRDTYASFLSSAREGHRRHAMRRRRLDEILAGEVRGIEQYARIMRAVPDGASVPLLALIERSIALGPGPAHEAGASERVPLHAVWSAHREALDVFCERLARVQEDMVFAAHPFRHLRADLAQAPRLVETVEGCIDKTEAKLEDLSASAAQVPLPAGAWDGMEGLLALVATAARSQPLAARSLLGLLSDTHEDGRKHAARLRGFRSAAAELNAARAAAAGWKTRLAPADTQAALEQARELEQTFLPFLRPRWRRLRRVLHASYDFASHAVAPRWTAVLETLVREYRAWDEVKRLQAEAGEALGIDGDPASFLSLVSALRDDVARGSAAGRILAAALEAGGCDMPLAALASHAAAAQDLAAELDRFLDGWRGWTVDELRDVLMGMSEALDELPAFRPCLAALAALPDELARAFREFACTPAQIEALSVRRTLACAAARFPEIERWDRCERAAACRRLLTAHEKRHAINGEVVRENVRRRFVEHLREAAAPASALAPAQREFKTRFNRGRHVLEHEFAKTTRYKAIRDLVSGESGLVVDDLKPVWLMSPLSVSDTLPLDDGRFDVVIFDEASQITLEEAVPALFRAGQAIVVGDQMQLPPTNFFSARSAEGEATVWIEDEDADERVEYDLGLNSFLQHAAANLPARMLGWHYRSRSESLISFSNWAFYQGRLLTVPEEQLGGRRMARIEVDDPAEGAARVDDVLARAVSFHLVKGAVYRNRRNRKEAEYIAHLVRGVLGSGARPSIGIVAFSEAQQGEIEDALERLGAEDPAFREALEAETVREDDGQYAGLLVKNLENIQGDERDLVILSVCYGHGPDGAMRMHFGPINQSGGEKRLNVAFSRAKRHMVLVSSIRADDITNDYNEGAGCLKNYLRYAAACSEGHMDGARGVLQAMCPWRADAAGGGARRKDALAGAVAAALQRLGYTVDHDVGMSDFRCDLGVRRDGDAAYRLGILLDTGGFYDTGEVLEREVHRPRLLSLFGWRIARITAAQWCRDADGVAAYLVDVLEQGGEGEAIAGDAVFGARLAAQLDALEGEESADAYVQDANGAQEEAPQAGVPLPDDDAAGGVLPLLEVREDVPRHFELRAGRTEKFWEITLSGRRFAVRYGRTGTDGQVRRKTFKDAAAARRAAAKAIDGKLRKGYEETRGEQGA